MSAYKCLSIVTGKLEMNVFEIPVHTGRVNPPNSYLVQVVTHHKKLFTSYGSEVINFFQKRVHATG